MTLPTVFEWDRSDCGVQYVHSQGRSSPERSRRICLHIPAYLLDTPCSALDIRKNLLTHPPDSLASLHERPVISAHAPSSSRHPICRTKSRHHEGVVIGASLKASAALLEVCSLDGGAAA